jgi:DNA-binding transcriptional regulator GbsR (MarR family)
MKISNPLTIIAIFAGVAETLATVALVNLPSEIQNIFVYFVMAFPAGIVLLFFWILYFKNTVLYAPSDYDNQSHYLEANKLKENVAKNVTDQVDQIFSEINKSGVRLTQEEISKAKDSLKNRINMINVLPRKNQIIEHLKNNPGTVKEISESLGIHRSYTVTVLRQLLEKNIVTKSKLEGSKSIVWSLNT